MQSVRTDRWEIYMYTCMRVMVNCVHPCNYSIRMELRWMEGAHALAAAAAAAVAWKVFNNLAEGRIISFCRWLK